MIKIDTGKGKVLSFDIDIEGGSDNEIKEGRFILSCPNKSYRLMFKALIENGTVIVDLPPLEINEKSGDCFLEMISVDSQYYQVWEDKVKFDRSLTIKVKEQKEDKILNVSLNEKEMIKENKIIKSAKKIMLYRTIKCNEEIINKIIDENKFSMKPKDNIPVKFYDNDTQLINDLENIEYGISISMNVCENGIMKKSTDHTLIINSSYLENIDESNVVFLIKEGKIFQLRKEK